MTLVELPSDDMKGRIIGREGRNIRALEHLTGVDFIIDDTPNAVVLSSFDGIRREVARLTLVKLIEDGRIHPARIEEMYYQSKAELEDHIRQAGEQAVFEANCGDFHEELVKILGRLRYRTSYGQNVLKHTLEVVQLAGIMAAELGASVKTAKRAALLHDLGKAMTHEVEGSHALISAQLAQRYGESQAVVHAIEAHHYEVQPQTVEAVLLISADAISASRPGARGESLENYIKRLESLEELAAQTAGRREGLRAAGRPRDPRDRQAGGDRRRRGRAALARDRARDRGPARVPGADQGDGDPREPRDRVREVSVATAPRRRCGGRGSGRAVVGLRFRLEHPVHHLRGHTVCGGLEGSLPLEQAALTEGKVGACRRQHPLAAVELRGPLDVLGRHRRRVGVLVALRLVLFLDFHLARIYRSRDSLNVSAETRPEFLWHAQH